MTVLITTHDMDEADELCDSLAIMHSARSPPSARRGPQDAASGPEATLDDVFVHYSGGTIQEEGNTVMSAKPDARQPSRLSRRAIRLFRADRRHRRNRAEEIAPRSHRSSGSRRAADTVDRRLRQVFSRVRAIPTGNVSYLAFSRPAFWRRAFCSWRSSTASP